jgi:hypothetical protein
VFAKKRMPECVQDVRRCQGHFRCDQELGFNATPWHAGPVFGRCLFGGALPWQRTQLAWIGTALRIWPYLTLTRAVPVPCPCLVHPVRVKPHHPSNHFERKACRFWTLIHIWRHRLVRIGSAETGMPVLCPNMACYRRAIFRAATPDHGHVPDPDSHTRRDGACGGPLQQTGARPRSSAARRWSVPNTQQSWRTYVTVLSSLRIMSVDDGANIAGETVCSEKAHIRGLRRLLEARCLSSCTRRHKE